MGTPFSLYATYKINDWFTAGLAVYTPYGSSVEWDQDWQGAHLVNNIDLQAIFVQPSISVRVGEHFSVGGGPIFATGSVNFNRNLSTNPLLSNPDTGSGADVTLDAKGITAWGYTAGFMFNPTKKLRIGMNYRSEIIMEARDGDADFNEVPGFVSDVTNLYDDQKFNADLPLPAELTVGLSYQVTDKWMLAFDYNRAMWSVYESLTVDFSNGNQSVNPRNYQNSSTYRVGTQYKANDKFTFRAGWYFDESPVQDGYFAPETPRNDSMGYTGGLTYQLNSKLGIDFSFLYLHFDEVDNSYDHYQENGNTLPFGGTYKSVVFSPGIGITYGF
jgi:long-chain fatty acid transport protein